MKSRTYSLCWNPGNFVVPPISPIFAQNIPLSSSGNADIDAATVAASPLWSSPVYKAQKLTDKHSNTIERHEKRIPISSGRKMVSGIENRSLFMMRIWSVSETISSGSLILPCLLDEKSGKMYSCTIGLLLGSWLWEREKAENIVNGKLWNLLADIEILSKLCRHVATCFFDVIHNISFVHHIPLTKWNEFLQLIG